MLLGVLTFAVLARWLGYTGFFGSDEVTYTAQAFKLLDGDWRVEDYVGANRLGVNLPMAAFAAVLGRTEFAAALYSLLSSVAEVGLVTWVAWRMFGGSVALFSGLLLASLPTHVHFAGRLMADAPLCFTITAAFVFLYEGDIRRWRPGLFLAGVFAGLSYWIKPPLMLFVVAVLLSYPLLVRRLEARWLWVAVGLVAAVLSNSLVFWALTGNFWYVLDVTRERQASGYLEAGVAAGQIVTDAHYYLRFLFVRIYHTGMLGYAVAAGLLLAWTRRQEFAPDVRQGLRFVIWWACGLLVVLSLWPVSLSPLVLVPKQINYMLILVAPLCVLAGWALAGLPRNWAKPIAAVLLMGGLLLSLMLQASVAVFTANSWATLRYVRDNPEATFFLMSNAERAASFDELLGATYRAGSVHSVGEWDKAMPQTGLAPSTRFAIIDEETFVWDGSRPFVNVQAVPACWAEIDVIKGRPQGLGSALLRLVVATPGLHATGLGQRLRALIAPKPARVYRLPAGAC